MSASRRFPQHTSILELTAIPLQGSRHITKSAFIPAYSKRRYHGFMDFQNCDLVTSQPQKRFLEPKNHQSGNGKLNLSAARPSKLLAHKYSEVLEMRDDK